LNLLAVRWLQLDDLDEKRLEVARPTHELRDLRAFE